MFIRSSFNVVSRIFVPAEPAGLNISTGKMRTRRANPQQLCASTISPMTPVALDDELTHHIRSDAVCVAVIR